MYMLSIDYNYLDWNTDKTLVEGEYVVRPFSLLVPQEPNAEEGIGGLVNCSMSSSDQHMDALGRGNVCDALACQCPSEEDIIQCCAQECKKRYHMHCVGILQGEKIPQQWFCQIENHSKLSDFRYLFLSIA